MAPRAVVLGGTGGEGKQVGDLGGVIPEGQPAIVNKIEISGNDVTHERVIREAIILLPGDVFRQDALIRSYQNISNLGFFQQPLRSEEHTSELQSQSNLVCRLLLEKNKYTNKHRT